MTGSVPVRFVPADVTVWVRPGTTVLEAARRAGIVISAPCGGRGRCGKCGVRIVEGEPPPPTALESAGLRLAPAGVRLACVLPVESPMTVRPIVAQSVSRVAATSDGSDTRTLLAAVDLGSTSVHAVVIDDESGLEIGRGVAINEQQAWGADVAERIAAALSGEGDALRHAAERSVVAALDAACGAAGACLKRVSRIVVAGNTTMAALLMGDDLTELAEAPYVAPRVEVTDLRDSALLDDLAPEARGVLFPGIASFVGGDLVAGLAVIGAGDVVHPSVLLDLGTNAEIAIASPDGVWVASAPAGPALEAVGVTSGGPAVDGAVSRITWNGERVDLEVIGGGEPLWLSGSGLVSLCARLRSIGHLGSDGRLITEGLLSERFVVTDGIVAFKVTDDIVLTQLDVRSVQLAKAAVTAGIVLAVRAAGVKAKRIVEWTVAGSFGSSLDARDLVDLGILPEEADGRVTFAGNTALYGAAMAAVDPESMQDVEKLATAAQHVDLASESGFNDLLVASTAFEPYSLKKRLRA